MACLQILGPTAVRLREAEQCVRRLANISRIQMLLYLAQLASELRECLVDTFVREVVRQEGPDVRDQRLVRVEIANACS